MRKIYFFGWENIKWFFRELNKIYSNQPSFFSKKRLESGIAFAIAQWGMIYFILEKHSTLTVSDMVMWSGVEFAVSGYIIHQIQKEKKQDNKQVEQKNHTEVKEVNKEKDNEIEEQPDEIPGN
jgi:hypothetical protein